MWNLNKTVKSTFYINVFLWLKSGTDESIALFLYSNFVKEQVQTTRFQFGT